MLIIIFDLIDIMDLLGNLFIYNDEYNGNFEKQKNIMFNIIFGKI
jgi:hypothetical protein